MSRRALPLAVVVAATPSGGIGKSGSIPWPHLHTDLANFKRLTTTVKFPGLQNAVVMGRRTWDSLPPKFKPLPGRLNIVLSSGEVPGSFPEGVFVAKSLDQALAHARSVSPRVETVFVIGGSQPIRDALKHSACSTVYLTRLAQEFDCDTFIPADLASQGFDEVYTQAPIEENGVQYTIGVWERVVDVPALLLGSVPSDDPAALEVAQAHQKALQSGDSTYIDPKSGYKVMTVGTLADRGTCCGSGCRHCPYSPRHTKGGSTLSLGVASSLASASLCHEEMQYLEAVRDIIESGVKRGDRTGVGTVSKFGVTMRFSLRGDVLPLLTTKRVFWRGVAEELLWFIAGSTNAKLLQAKGIKIWDDNASRAFLDSRGLSHREEGDLGPVYGFQWRHFGAEYGTMHDDYTGKGFDQLAEVIKQLKTNPTDRRIILSAWNPSALKDMALPPCHLLAQFYVANNELSCLMFQRSGDMGLGIPFNIASYSLLTRLLAQVAGLQAGEFVHVIGDAHVYLNHIEPLMEQLARTPKPFPKLHIDPSINDIEQFRFEHFTLEGYEPHGPIKMAMAV